MDQRYLVACSIGDDSRAASWLDGASGFDVALVHYGEKKCAASERARFFLENRDFKCPNYTLLFDTFPEALEYDYFLFIDDDIVLTASQIAQLFSRAKQERLDLCQPALTPESAEGVWPHLRQKPGKRTETTDFVEVGCFCVSRRFLRKALPFFYMARTGMGLDVAFSLLLKDGKFRAAILHDIGMYHPQRPESQSVRGLMPDFESFGKSMLRRIDFCFGEDGAARDLQTASELFGEVRWQGARVVKWGRAISQGARVFGDRISRRFVRRR